MRLSHRARHGVLGGALLAIVFVRAPGMLLLPPLEVEDGVHLFANFYSHRDVEHLWRLRMGYMHPYPHLLAYAAVRLPVRAAPYLLSGAALALALAAYALFHARRYRVVLPSDGTRAAVCLALVLDPFASHHFLSHAENLGWNGLLAIMLLTLLPAPRRRAPGWFLAVNLLAYTHPLTVLALPLVLRGLPRARGAGQRAAYALTALNLVAWHLVSSMRVGGPPEILGYVWLTAGFAIRFLQGFVLFRTAFGDAALAGAVRHAPWLVPLWTLAVTAALALTVARARPAVRRWLGGVAWIVAASLFAAFFVRGEMEVFVRPLRFGYVPAAVLVVSAGIAAAAWARRWRVPRAWRRIAAAGALAWLALLNAGHTAAYRAVDPGNGRLVADFLRRLDGLERERGWRCLAVRLDKIGDWPIEIDTLAECPGGPR